MFYILFICYFCFYFIFTVYRNVPNTVVFMVRKGMKKAIWNTAPLYPWGQYNFKLFPTTPSPHRLLHFDIFSNHAYYSTSPSIRDLSNGQVFRLILSFLSNRLLRLVQDGKSSQEYPINAGVPQGFILGPTLFLIYINDLPDVLCNIAINADDTTLYSKYDQAFDFWQQVGLWTWTCGMGRSYLVLMLRKLNLFRLTVLITLVLLMWK